uniref:Putative ABC transporter ATP-binding protein HI_1618 n=1 Tax=Anthurium amnicola TaxID=1678845 RepID=A0A1D1Z5N2_9ARAE
MLGFFRHTHKLKPIGTLGVSILREVSSPLLEDVIVFGPFNSNTPKRWKKPVDSAQTRLENRTLDHRLDKLMSHFKKLRLVLSLQEVISSRKGHYASVQLLSKWKSRVGLNVGIGAFLRKYPHIFEMYTHKVKRNICCKLTQKMVDLIEEEARVIKESELVAVQRLKKLLVISTSGTLHVHALWLIRRELGLPDDLRNSILIKYPNDFRLVSPEIVSLVSSDEMFEAEVEIWREKECREKWLSEFETRYAFPIQFPTGFKIEKGFREKLKNWQRLQYVKPYEKMEKVRIRTCGGVERFEKRAVGIIHELLSLTVEKMIEVERLSHFRRDFSMEVNMRELLLKHPGIFYISTKGNNQTVFLREAYSRGCLIEPNLIYSIRRKMLDLILMGCRDTGQLHPLEKLEKQSNQVIHRELVGGPYDGEWILPIFENLDEQFVDHRKLVSSSPPDSETNE